MDPPRVASSTAGAAGVSGALKAAAARAKGATANVVKRKRGALQDISNSHVRGVVAASIGNATGVGVKKSVTNGPTKPAHGATTARGVKRSASSMSQPTAPVTTANVRVRGARASGSHANAAVTKRRRENATEDAHATGSTASGKVQTSLLSFNSIAPTKSAAHKKAKPSAVAVETVEKDPQEKKDIASQVTSNDPDMECTETLKAETSQPEPTPSATIAAAEEQISTKATEVEAPQPVSAPSVPVDVVPPYEPRPYVFKFDHTQSGFDEETYRSQIHDIDAPFLDSAIYCVKIARDMDRFHRQHEDKYHPSPDYIGNVQLDINEKMRTILIDWLVEVGEEYELDSQTFHKTVNLVDRCLAKFKINRKQFQLLGCACMMIAAKFEEVYGPNVDEFVYISDQTYTSEEMLEMEVKVLQALEYRIASTTCHGFLPRYTRAGCTTDKQRFLVQYLCDFAMLYYHMLEYRPSMLAAAAVYLSRLMTNEEQPWTPTLHHFTQFNAWELKACVMDLYRLHLAESELVETQRDKAKAVSEKYVSEKFLGVSATPSVEESVLEQSFLSYEQPLHMRHQPKQEAASAESSGSED